MSNTLTVLDILRDEEKALLDRLSKVRNRIARVQRGELLTDSVCVTVAVGAQSVSVAGVKGAGN